MAMQTRSRSSDIASVAPIPTEHTESLTRNGSGYHGLPHTHAQTQATNHTSYCRPHPHTQKHRQQVVHHIACHTPTPKNAGNKSYILLPAACCLVVRPIPSYFVSSGQSQQVEVPACAAEMSQDLSPTARSPVSSSYCTLIAAGGVQTTLLVQTGRQQVEVP